MLKLYGFPLSNYYNMVKMALLEKDIPFTEVKTKPSQDAEYLRKSPMGKVPCLETEHGFLSETDVIFDYLEEAYPAPAFLPADPYARAKVRELIKEIELYIELPARTCYAEAYFGGTVSDEVKEKARTNLQKGLACLQRNGKFSPYVAGEQFTYADMIFLYTLGIAASCTKRVLNFSLLDGFSAVKPLLESLSQRPSAIKIAADQKADA